VELGHAAAAVALGTGEEATVLEAEARLDRLTVELRRARAALAYLL